jgi:hypothetical protein
VQCRLGKTTVDIYRDALSQLEVRLEVEKTSEKSLKGRVEASGDLGVKILAKLGVTASAEAETKGTTKTSLVGRDIADLRYIAYIIRESGKVLVIEDFHYLSTDERRNFAFDLKALWDYGCFVVIVGVWGDQDLLLHLNGDLTGRVVEKSVSWTPDELKKVIRAGGSALNLHFGAQFENRVSADAFGNVGLLQALTLGALDHLGINEAPTDIREIDELVALETATMEQAEQLNPVYQTFAKRVSDGIRTRKDSTGIYAHAMAAIMDSTDDELKRGVSIDTIYERAHDREPRIQKGNLRTVLEKFEQLQVDDDGRGLVLAYNTAKDEITVVDRQILLYRKYSTIKWPWDDLIEESKRTDTD